MLFIRRSATLAVLTVLACTVTLLGAASPAPRASAAAAGTSSVSPSAVSPKAVSPRAVKPKTATTVGRPPRNTPMRPGSVFSYPNRGKKKQLAIRNRVLNTIKSTWGGRRYSSGSVYPSNGRIRIATWTFQDWAIARALWKAYKRGVSVQVLSAKGPNSCTGRGSGCGSAFRTRATARDTPRRPADGASPGSARGRVEVVAERPLEVLSLLQRRRLPRAHDHDAELDEPDGDGLQGQWNHATITWRRGVHAAFSRIFAESRRDRPASKTYRRFVHGKVQSTFFPRPGTTANYDPVMRALRKVSVPGHDRGW